MQFLDDFVLVFLDDILIYSQDARGARAARPPRAGDAAQGEALRQGDQVRVLQDRGRVPRPPRRPRRRAHDGGQGQGRAATGRRRPRSTHVRAFLGTAGYYRKFIKDFSAIAAPLTELTKDVREVRLGPPAGGAFRRLKAAIAEGPVLHLPDPDAAVRRAHGCVRLRRRCRASAGPGQGLAAHRLPVEEDARCRDALSGARAGVARDHPLR